MVDIEKSMKSKHERSRAGAGLPTAKFLKKVEIWAGQCKILPWRLFSLQYSPSHNHRIEYLPSGHWDYAKSANSNMVVCPGNVNGPISPTT